MATVSNALQQVKAHLHEVLPDQEIFDLCRRVGHRWRNRLLNPAVTVQLFLLQLLAKVAMQGLRHVAKLSVTAQAICKAKQRLPLQLLMELVALSAPQGPVRTSWKDLAVYLADGMSFMTPDTPELAERYGKAKNQRGTGFGYPTPKLLALMDFGGVIHKVIALPWARQEFTCLSRLFRAVARGALLLGDRGLVSFTHLALLLRAGLHGCFRLPRGQVTFGRGKASRRKIKSLGKQDMLVRWTAYRRPAWLSKKRWQTLANEVLTLRQISFRVYRKGFRVQWAWIITTLLDPEKYPAQELIQLYSQRWQVEVYFRDLKKTLGIGMISARTATGVRKEILAFVLLYNLVRRVMQQAAVAQGVAADRVSFIDTMRWLLWSSPGDPIPKLKLNARRVRPSPPRRLKNARHRFPQLNNIRAALTKPRYTVML
jgi:hypothetical protein